jgi:hypothetical protein
MSEKSPKDGKSGSPKVRKSSRSEVGSPKSEEENNSIPDILPSEIEHSAIDISNSEINNSAINTSEIEHPTSKIKEMEVHHHPEVEKKGFKEYLLEGLMIFIAVMMGFFAESLREHRTEKSKEGEYIRSMISDLKKDTANLRHTLNQNNYCTRGLDSLILLLNSSKRSQYGSELYYLARVSAFRISLLEPTDRVYNEMKSSGNLRLISEKEISDGITTYYYDVEDWKSQNEIIRQLTLNYLNSVSKVFDGAVFQKMINDPGFKFPQLPKPIGNPPLASTGKADITELTGAAHFLYARVSSKTKGSTKLFLSEATGLLKLLEKQYDIEDE